MALNGIDETFYMGGFDKLPKTVANRDLSTAQKMLEFEGADKTFLTTSPEWQDRQFVHPNMMGRAQQAARDLVEHNPADPLNPDPFYSSALGNVQFDDLASFKVHGLSGREMYIANAGLSELPKILQLPGLQNSLQRVALDRLMQSLQGRLMALEVYTSSTDRDLRQLIEEEPSWQKVLKADIGAVRNSADNRILRLALLKFYDNTSDAGYLNLRLSTYSIAELHSAKDPRGGVLVKARIKVEAAKIALKVIESRTGHKARFWAGENLMTPQEVAEMATIKAGLEQENDPVKAMNDFDYRASQAGRDVRGFYKDFNSIITEFAGYITNDDQSFPHFNTWEKWSYTAVLAGISLLIGRALLIIWRKSKMDHDESYSAAKSKILPRALLKVKKKAVNGNGTNGNGKTTNGNGPAASHAMLSMDLAPPSDVLEATDKHFNAWYDVIARWSEQYEQHKEIPVETLIEDLNQILNCAVEVLEDAPFKSKLMSTPEIQYQNTYIYFNLIIQQTLLVLLKHVDVDFLSETQKKRLGDSINTLFDNVNYGKRFTRILAYRGNIDKIMSYTLPKYHWLERSGLNPLTRRILGLQNTWMVSERKLFEELNVLLDEGNALSPGLYGNDADRTEMVEETRAALKDMTDNGSSIFDPTFRYDRRVNRITGFAGRVVTISGLVTSVLSLIAWLVNFSWVTVGGLSLGSFFWIGVTFSMFWYPQWRLLQMEGLSMMDLSIEKLEKEFKRLLPEEMGRTRSQDQDAEIVALNRQEGAEQVTKELDQNHRPSVDMIVLVPQSRGYRAGLEGYLQKMRGKIIRRDIPAEVVTSDYQGSGTIYLDVMEKARIAYEERRAHDPTLRPWSEARIMFVFHGEDAYLDNSIEEELLNWTITNGYRAARKGYEEGVDKHQAGQILVYSRDAGAYFGDMPRFPKSGVIVGSSRVNSRVLKESSFVHTTSTGEITELLEDVDIDHLKERDTRMPRGGRLIKYLKENYDLELPDLAQYEVSNGIFMVGPDAVKVLEKIRAYITENNLWNRIYRLTSDLLIPMIMSNTWGKDEARKETGSMCRKGSGGARR